MNVFMLMTGTGPTVVLTKHNSAHEEGFIAKVAQKGIEKSVAYKISTGLAEQRYGSHFRIVEGGLGETDDLRVLDEDGERAFKLFRFTELWPPLMYEPNGSSH